MVRGREQDFQSQDTDQGAGCLSKGGATLAALDGSPKLIKLPSRQNNCLILGLCLIIVCLLASQLRSSTSSAWGLYPALAVRQAEWPDSSFLSLTYMILGLRNLASFRSQVIFKKPFKYCWHALAWVTSILVGLPGLLLPVERETLMQLEFPGSTDSKLYLCLKQQPLFVFTFFNICGKQKK